MTLAIELLRYMETFLNLNKELRNVSCENRFSISESAQKPLKEKGILHRGLNSCDNNKNDTKCYRNNINFILY